MGTRTRSAVVLRPYRFTPTRRPSGLAASLQPLEARQMLSASSPSSPSTSDVRSYDGTGNNPWKPNWGAAGVDLLREAPAAYGDLISSPGGVGRPSARAVSNAVAADPVGETLNDRSMAAFVYAWGQFIDHDLDLTGAASPAEAFNVAVPSGDAYLDPAGTGTQQVFLNRSQYDPATGTGRRNPRQQVNTITAWLDGSVVYGSDATRAAALRTFAGGHL